MKLVQLTINDEGFIRWSQNLWAFNNSGRKSNEHIDKNQKKKFELMNTHGNKDLKDGISGH